MTEPAPRRDRGHPALLWCRTCQETLLGVLSRDRGRLELMPGVTVTASIPGTRADLACPHCGQLRSVTDVIISVVAAEKPASAA